MKARKVDELVGEIAAASKEQAQGIAQVNIAVSQVDKVTQLNAASAEESASASEQMSAHARTLKDGVVELSKLVGSNTMNNLNSITEPGRPKTAKSRSTAVVQKNQRVTSPITSSKTDDSRDTIGNKN